MSDGLVPGDRLDETGAPREGNPKATTRLWIAVKEGVPWLDSFTTVIENGAKLIGFLNSHKVVSLIASVILGGAGTVTVAAIADKDEREAGRIVISAGGDTVVHPVDPTPRTVETTSVTSMTTPMQPTATIGSGVVPPSPEPAPSSIATHRPPPSGETTTQPSAAQTTIATAPPAAAQLAVRTGVTKDEAPAHLAFGKLQAGIMTGPGEELRWAFHGAKDQEVVIDVSMMGGEGQCAQALSLTLVEPDGRHRQVGTVGNWGCINWLLRLDQTGSYQLLWASSEAGTPEGRFQFEASDRLAARTHDLTYDTLLNGRIDGPFMQERWRFNVDRPGQLLLEVTMLGGEGECGRDIYVSLISPGGSEGERIWMYVWGCSQYPQMDLPEAGSYELVFEGGEGLLAIGGPYRFRVSMV